MWMRSTASRRRSPFARRTPRAIRARRSPRPRSSTISCACCGLARGAPICPNCNIHVERDSVDQVGDKNARAAGRVALVRAVSAGPGAESTDALRDRLFDLRKKGFNRLFQAGSVVEFSTPESLLESRFLQARLRPGGPPGNLARHAPAPGRHGGDLLSRSGRSRFRAGAGRRARLRFNEKFACKRCGKEFVEPEPSLFSFNSPQGACKRCQGFGNTIDYDMDLVIPEPVSVDAGRRGGSVDQAAALPATWSISARPPKARSASPCRSSS